MGNNYVQKIHNAYIGKDEKELERLWLEDAPKTLIKFFPAKYEEDGTNYFLKHINEQTIWLASPLSFNDPFDCVINLDPSIEMQRIIREETHGFLGKEEAEMFFNTDFVKMGLKQIYTEFEENFVKEAKEYEKRIYVTCFSESENLYSLRMWGHYANNHSGVCAEYDFNTVKDISPFACIPIMYTDTYSYNFETRNANDKIKSILALVYNKASEWAYEKEWRAAYCLNQSNGRGFNARCGLPKKVYLGCNVSGKLKKDVIDMCIDKNIEVLQMKLKPDSYKLFF